MSSLILALKCLKSNLKGMMEERSVFVPSFRNILYSIDTACHFGIKRKSDINNNDRTNILWIMNTSFVYRIFFPIIFFAMYFSHRMIRKLTRNAFPFRSFSPFALVGSLRFRKRGTTGLLIKVNWWNTCFALSRTDRKCFTSFIVFATSDAGKILFVNWR